MLEKKFILIIGGNGFLGQAILNKFDPDDEIEVDIQEFDGKKIVNVKILDRILN